MKRIKILSGRTATAILLSVMSLAIPFSAKAQDEISGKEKKEIVKKITSDYKNWNKAGFQAKVRTEMLPVDVTMKVYMEKNRLTLISLRAPLVGEAARVEIDNDSILIVNKLKRKFCSLPLDDVRKLAPEAMEYIQSTLLGRIVLAGHGELSTSNAKYLTLYAADSVVLAVPELKTDLTATYGYQLDADLRINTIMAAFGKPHIDGNTDDGNPDYRFSTAVTIPITYKGKNSVADIEAVFRNRTYYAQITSEPVEWGAKGFDRYQLGKGFSRCSIKEIFRF